VTLLKWLEGIFDI